MRNYASKREQSYVYINYAEREHNQETNVS